MFETGTLNKFFEMLNKNLPISVSIYLICGGNLSLKGIKTTTKDVDLVLTSNQELKPFMAAMESSGFETDKELLKEAVYRDATIVFKDSSGTRIDVFVKTICNQLNFSPAMIKRSERYLSLSKLTVFLASNEDIFLFKSVTDRPQDIEDCFALINTNLNWDIIISECVDQHRKDVKWVFWLFEQICRIENAKQISLPIKNKVFQVCTDNWKRRPKSFMAGIEMVGQHVPKEYLRDVKPH